MEITAKTCPEYNARLRTAADLINKVKVEIKRNTLVKKNIVWLELTGCSGNIISLLDGANPDFKYLITDMVNFTYNNSLMAAEGEAAIESLINTTGTDYILAIEGAISTKITLSTSQSIK